MSKLVSFWANLVENGPFLVVPPTKYPTKYMLM